MNGVTVDVDLNQIMREGFPAIIHLSPMQSELIELYAKHMPRPVHNDIVIARRWTDQDNPMQNVKTFVCQVNYRLAALNLMLRRSAGFGYFLVNADDPKAQIICDRAEAIREAARA